MANTGRSNKPHRHQRQWKCLHVCTVGLRKAYVTKEADQYQVRVVKFDPSPPHSEHILCEFTEGDPVDARDAAWEILNQGGSQ